MENRKGVRVMKSDGGRFGRFKIRGVFYPTYKTVRAEIKRRIGKYAGIGPQSFDDDDVDWFVHCVREMHPYADRKLCKRVVGIRKYNRYGVNGDNLMLVYEDGSAMPFSWNKCCKGKQSSDGISVKNAMRAAVEDQTSAVMDAAFKDSVEIVCPMCGEWITRKTAHVDHAAPMRFADLVQAWLIDRDLTFDKVLLVDDPQGGSLMALGPTLDSWRAFHEQNAVLRVVSARWNTSKEARG
jgi:hypothetical protein